MKKLMLFLSLCLLLTGCSTEETFETVLDLYDVSAISVVQKLSVSLPDEAVQAAMENVNGENLYFCNGYTVATQTCPGGDLDATILACTGFDKDRLTLLQSKQGEIKRYESVWTAAGEAGEQIARCVILDDGNYHYVVTVMAEASKAGEYTAQWQHILDSASLSTG